MDVVRCIENELDESLNLEYKDKRAGNHDIVKELVAFSNASGGTLILGVREDAGKIEQIQDVTDFSQREETVNQIISSNVQPPIQVDCGEHEVGGKTVVSFSVDETEQVHSFSEGSQPVYPRRQGSTIDYMGAQEVRNRMQGDLSPPSQHEEEHSPLDNPLDEEIQMVDIPDIHFSPIPEGYINRVCTFSSVHWPQNPYSANILLGEPTNEELIEIFTALVSFFQFRTDTSWFTIHQQTGAWFGRGIHDYLSALLQEDYRMAKVPEEYDLTTYKNAIGVFVGEIESPYPESCMLVHVEPWHGRGHCRRMTIEIIFNGVPLDTRPIENFLGELEAGMTNAEKKSISKDIFPHPDKLPVETLDLIGSPWKDDFVSDAVCQNPLFGNEDAISAYMDLFDSGGIAEYQYIPGHIRDHHPRAEPKEYDSTGFVVTEFDEIGERIPVSLHNVDFKINW